MTFWKRKPPAPFWRLVIYLDEHMNVLGTQLTQFAGERITPDLNPPAGTAYMAISETGFTIAERGPDGGMWPVSHELAGPSAIVTA